MSCLQRLGVVVGFCSVICIAASCSVEPRATLHGTATSALAGSSEPTEVALVWLANGINVAATSATLTGNYPEEFTLELVGAPPEAAILSSESRLARGVVYALRPGTLDTLQTATTNDVLGLVRSHIVEYFEDDAAADSTFGEQGAGYHLYFRGFPEGDAQWQAYNACLDQVTAQNGGNVPEDAMIETCGFNYPPGSPYEVSVATPMGVEIGASLRCSDPFQSPDLC